MWDNRISLSERHGNQDSQGGMIYVLRCMVWQKEWTVSKVGVGLSYALSVEDESMHNSLSSRSPQGVR